MPFCLFGTSSMYLQLTRLLKTVVTYTLAYNFPIRGTFSPSWIKKMSSRETRKWCGKKLRWEEEDACATPRVTRSGWSELKLPLAFFLSFFFPSLLKRNRREGREAEATGDLLDYQFDAWGEWVRKREGGERWGCAGVKGKGVKKRSDVFISSPVCLVAPGSGFSQRPHLLAHCLVTAKCVKTPPTKTRERGRLSVTMRLPVHEWRTNQEPTAHKWTSVCLMENKDSSSYEYKKKWCTILTLVLHHALVELIRNSYESRNSSWRPDFTQ